MDNKISPFTLKSNALHILCMWAMGWKQYLRRVDNVKGLYTHSSSTLLLHYENGHCKLTIGSLLFGAYDIIIVDSIMGGPFHLVFSAV